MVTQHKRRKLAIWFSDYSNSHPGSSGRCLSRSIAVPWLPRVGLSLPYFRLPFLGCEASDLPPNQRFKVVNTDRAVLESSKAVPSWTSTGKMESDPSLPSWDHDRGQIPIPGCWRCCIYLVAYDRLYWQHLSIPCSISRRFLKGKYWTSQGKDLNSLWQLQVIVHWKEQFKPLTPWKVLN